MPFSLPATLSITRFNFFCLQVLLTRDSLLALAKSIYYFIIVAVKILIEALKVRLRYYNFYPVEELVYLIWFNCTHLLVLSLRKTSREIKENKVMVRLQLTLKLVKLRDQVPCITLSGHSPASCPLLSIYASDELLSNSDAFKAKLCSPARNPLISYVQAVHLRITKSEG